MHIIIHWLVVSTHLKNISQIGSFPNFRGENKKIFQLPPPSPSLMEQKMGFQNAENLHLQHLLKIHVGKPPHFSVDTSAGCRSSLSHRVESPVKLLGGRDVPRA